jgi:hypothetical protein
MDNSAREKGSIFPGVCPDAFVARSEPILDTPMAFRYRTLRIRKTILPFITKPFSNH